MLLTSRRNPQVSAPMGLTEHGLLVHVDALDLDAAGTLPAARCLTRLLMMFAADRASFTGLHTHRPPP